MNNNSRYNNLGKKPVGISPIKINTSTPKLTETDYKRGYVERYFVAKANDENSLIYEVLSENFLRVIKSPLYIGVKIRWRIKGDVTDVKVSNKKSLDIASEKIKNLKLYLPNLLQFHK